MGIIMKDGQQYGVGGIQKAESITYDNIDSGMTATNVQGALDELSAGLSQMLTIEVPVSSQSVASMRRTYHAYTIPTGYKPVGALYVGTDDTLMSAIVCNNIARVFNTDINTHTANGTIYVFLFPDSN